MDHMKIRSGDDNLFINQAANAQNTTINFNSESFTYSEAKNISDLVSNKRHISTSKYLQNI